MTISVSITTTPLYLKKSTNHSPGVSGNQSDKSFASYNTSNSKKQFTKKANHIAKTASSQTITAKAINEMKIEGYNPENPNEVKIEGYNTLSNKQKQNLKVQLKSYKEKILSSIKDESFDKFIEMAFGRKVDKPEELAALKKAANNGEWDKVIPKIKLGDENTFKSATVDGKAVNAMGAFVVGSGENDKMGTIILRSSLLDGPITTKNGEKINFQDILTEEIAHSWDAKLNINDSKGDEGEALSVLLGISAVHRKGFLNSLKAMKSQGTDVTYLEKASKQIDADVKGTLDALNKALADDNDHGKLTITNSDGTKSEIDVEFFLGIGKALKRLHKNVTNAAKDIAKTLVKSQIEFFTTPLRIISSILPDDNFIESSLDALDEAVDKSFELLEKIEEELKDLADKAWEKFEKNVLQSKWLGPVLMVMSFIPVLGTVAMVAQLALAAYQVAKGLETGNMAMVMGGVMSAVGGATAGGLITGATATTIATAAKTGYAAYNGVQAAKDGNWAGVATAAVAIAGTTGAIDAGTASNINQGINIEQAIENKDYVGALTSSVALAGNTGVIEKDTAKNIQQTVAFGKAIDDGDASAAIRLGTSYVGNSDWAKENPETYSALETGSNIYSVIEDDEMTEEQKATAITKTLYDQKLISQKAYNNLNKGTELYEIVKGNETDSEKVAAISNYLYDQGLINEELNKNINTGSDIYGVVKSDKTDAEKAKKVSEYLYDAGAIEQETYDTVQTGLGAYNIAKGDGNSVEITQKMNDYLFEKGVIDFDTHSTINTAANTFEGTKNDNEKAKAYLELLQKFEIIDPETLGKLNELISASEGNTDEIIAKITSDESTLLDSETKKMVKESYELYAQGEETYKTIKNGSSSEQAKLFTESAVNIGMIDQTTANELYANYQDGKSIFDTVTKGSTKERVELLVDTGIIDKKITEELYAFYDDGKKAYDTITNGSTSERVKLLINSGVIDETTAKELYAYYEVGKATYDNATNSVAA